MNLVNEVPCFEGIEEPEEPVVVVAEGYWAYQGDDPVVAQVYEANGLGGDLTLVQLRETLQELGEQIASPIYDLERDLLAKLPDGLRELVARRAYEIQNAAEAFDLDLPSGQEVIEAGGLNAWIAGIPAREAKAEADAKRWHRNFRRRERYWERKEAAQAS